MRFHASVDFETYSEAGYIFDPIKKVWTGVEANKAGITAVGAAVYSEHSSTFVRCMAYRLPHRPKRLWTPQQPPPVDFFQYIQAGSLVEAHNVLFEYFIWLNVCWRRMGWPPLRLEQLRCSMAKANHFGLPGKLEHGLTAIGAPINKDPHGKRLIRKLSIPQRITKKNLHQICNDPVLLDQFGQYCLQDIESEDFLSASCPDLSPFELQLWQLDQRINARGVSIDTHALAMCENVIAQASDRYTLELRNLTNNQVGTANELQKMRNWLKNYGVFTDSLKAANVTALLDNPNLPTPCRKVLEIRQYLSSTSVKKLRAIRRMLCSDNRLRGLFMYSGALRTHRWAGRGPQPQNLPAFGPKIEKCQVCGRIYLADERYCPICGYDAGEEADWGINAVETALSDMEQTTSLAALENRWGDVFTLVAGCLRGLFVASPGHELIASDFSAIEAVVLAELAEEPWRQEVFRTHGKIYEMTASRILGIPFQEILDYPKTHGGRHHPKRKAFGKIPELASGYGGGVGAWLAFGAGNYMNEEEIQANIKKWREDSPNIVRFWWNIQDTAIASLQCPHVRFTHKLISFFYDGRHLYCILPSGGYLTYHNARVGSKFLPWGKEAPCIYYMGWNSDSTRGSVGWVLQDTYGPKLVENITQATARDLLAYSMLNLDHAGYPIVLHVHDEVAAEVRKRTGDIKHFERIMAQLPAWAAGWPVKAAGGWVGYRYRKD